MVRWTFVANASEELQLEALTSDGMFAPSALRLRHFLTLRRVNSVRATLAPPLRHRVSLLRHPCVTGCVCVA